MNFFRRVVGGIAVLCVTLLVGCGGGTDPSVFLNTVQPKATLVVTKVGSGSVTANQGALACGNSCSEDYLLNTPVRLTAAPDAGYKVAGWSGTGIDCAPNPTCTVSMDQTLTVQTTFSVIESTDRQLDVTISGAGVVSSAPSGIDCSTSCTAFFADGVAVTLTATPAAGHNFTGWSGGSCSGATPTCVVQMSAALGVTATFAAVPAPTQLLTVTVSGSGNVGSSPAGINSCNTSCSASFNQDTVVTLAAAPAAGYQFAGWTGGCGGTGTCVVTMAGARSVGANFTPVAVGNLALNVVVNGSGTVTSAPGGINCGTICSASFASGSSVALTAMPASGYVFSGWSGGGCSGTGSCLMALSATTTVAATFSKVTYTLSVTKTGSGTVSSNVGGISCGTVCSASITVGTNVTLTAMPASGYVFSGWSGGGCAGTGNCVVGVSAATSVAATFTKVNYVLSVSVTGSGTVTSTPTGVNCSSACNVSYVSGTSVSLVATPASGYQFSGWGGACTGTGTCTVSMSAAKVVTATFAATPVSTFALNVALVGSGSVSSSPAGISCGATCTAVYNANASVTLTATPASGYTFSGWSGACTGTGACAVTMSAVRTVTATFAATTFALSVTAQGQGAVTSSPSGINCGATCSSSYALGTSVTLTATPSAGANFTGWSGSCAGTATTCTLAISAARSVTATFASATQTLSVNVTGTGSVSSSPAGIASCAGNCSASFALGSSVSLTATAGSGFQLSAWGGSCSDSGACTVPMDQARNVSATFTAIPAPAPGSATIPLTLGSAPAATSIPVRSGIPFPKGALGSVSNARLESADGTQEVPAQFDTLASWPDGSVKSALVQFVTDVGASAKSYRVAYGTSVTRSAVNGAVSVTQASGATTVDTGAIKYVVDAKGLINALWRDANHNGSYEAGEQVLGAGEFFMTNAFNGVEYTASQAGNASIAIEEQGPIRAVIRASGVLTGAGGATLVKYQVRYYAYAGSDKLDIDFTVIDDRGESNVETPGNTLALAAKGYGLRWNYLSDTAAQYRFGLEGGTTTGGAVSGEHYLLQNGGFAFDNGVDKGNTFNYSGVASGARAPGWMALDSGSRHLALMVRDFWQQYPIELNIKGNTLTAALFAERALGGSTADTTVVTQSGTTYKRPNDFYFLRQGGAKTHQLRLAFGDSLPVSSAIDQINSGFQRHRLELTADPSWYAASGVFGDINVGTSTGTVGYSASMLQDIYIPSIETNPSDATMYGWRDYGDRLRAGWNNEINGVRIPSFYNDTHIGANNFFHEFVRTGEQRWFQLGEISTHHFEDVDVAHGPRKGYWDTGYPMGQQPAGEIHAMGHNNEDHQMRNMHWGHAHVSGLSDLYLLTGDKRSLEVLTEIANWWKFVTPYFFKTPFDKNQYREAERDYAWPLYVMNEYVRVTGDATYHKTVNAQLVNYLIQWWQTPMNHIGYNPATKTISNSAVINVNDASTGTGYWTMYHMDNDSTSCSATAPNICPDGTNPWMAGALLSSVIKFYEQDKLMAAAGKGAGISYATIEDMLFQDMNYIVKYGYDTTNNWFVYSEVTRTYSGGHTLIDYPLAYLDRLYKQRFAAGAVPHPEWYGTQATWSTIASGYYQGFLATKVGASTQSYGFYGYEMVTPVDFFKIMSGQ